MHLKIPSFLRQCLTTMTALSMFAPVATHCAGTGFGLDAEFTHDTNVNRAAYPNEEQADDIFAVEGYAARGVPLSYRSGLLMRGGLRLREHREFGDLSNAAALGRVAYRFQPSPGYTGAWVELAGSAELLRYRDSGLRDGYIVAGSISAGKHFTDRIRADAGLELDEREGKEGALYDLSTTRAWLALDYRITPRITVYGSTNWIQGDHVFTANYPATQAQLSPYAEVTAPDPAFADAFGGVPVTAYRMEASTLLLEAGVNIPLGGNQAFDFGASWFNSKADQGGGKYDGATFRLGYLYRFR
ncbi:MAG TPA: hypothetical protein VN664_04015 [Burkholderiales bacterium]|jgi:hypothetical protein|nr:hypothetical protein [Burkholderiales bacterium]